MEAVFVVNKNVNMDENRIEKILEFLKEIDKFKTVYRTALTTSGSFEDDAGHTWHMCMYALLLQNELKIDVNLQKVFEMVLVHDLVEIYAGDTPAFDHNGRNGKKEREIQAAEKLFNILPDDLKTKIDSLWGEYEESKTPEAKFVKAIDRLQGFAQNNFTDGKLWKQLNIKEDEIRNYNLKTINFYPELVQIFEILFKKSKDKKDF